MQEKLSLLKSVLGDCWNNNEEYLFFCPECNHEKRKLSVNIQKEVFKCWICDYRGKSIKKLLRKHASQEQFSQWLNITNQIDLSKYEYIFQDAPKVKNNTPNLELPAEFKSILDKKNKNKASEPMKYLLERNIGFETCLKWRIGFCDSGAYYGRIIIPSFDCEGKLNYFIARSYKGSNLKYKNPPTSKNVVFNDIDINWQNDVILVEGVFDAMRCENSIPLLGSSLREDSELFAKICTMRPRIFLALDRDAKDKEFSIYKKLKQYGLSVFSIDTSPYSDVGEMPEHIIKQRKQNADIVSDLDYLHYKLNF